MVLDIFALVVMGVLVAFIVFLVVKVGPLPGNIARRRGHPQADAVYVLGWIGVITLGLAWPFALVWAYARPSEKCNAALAARIYALEAELATLKAGGDA